LQVYQSLADSESRERKNSLEKCQESGPKIY
jgi:hypothetical protein